MTKPRLRTLPAILPTLAPRLGYAPGDEKARSKMRHRTMPWRGWYHTRRWERLRWSVLVRDLFQCQLCKRTISEKGAAVADHIKPHRGDKALFWSEANLQCLCSACHDSVKQREELRTP